MSACTLISPWRKSSDGLRSVSLGPPSERQLCSAGGRRIRESATLMQPPGLHMPCRRSLGVRLERSWHTGPEIPRSPMCDSDGSGQVIATHLGIAMHAARATSRGSVHWRPKGGGVMHPKEGSEGRPAQPMESGTRCACATHVGGVGRDAMRATRGGSCNHAPRDRPHARCLSR